MTIAIITKVLTQDAVWWQKIGEDELSRSTYAIGQPVKVRWNDFREEIITYNGRKTTSKAKIMVGVDMDVGDILQLGLISNPPPIGIPTEAQGGYEILLWKGILSVDGSSKFRQATV